VPHPVKDEALITLGHLTGLLWPYTSRMGIRPIDRLQMWFNRPRKCAECGVRVSVNPASVWEPALCSDECRAEYPRSLAV
jgi:hypothetical protein